MEHYLSDSTVNHGDFMTFSYFLSFRVAGDGGNISKGKIYSLKARVRYIHLDSYLHVFLNNCTSVAEITILI